MVNKYVIHNLHYLQTLIFHFPSWLGCFMTLFELADFPLCRYWKMLWQIFLPASPRPPWRLHSYRKYDVEKHSTNLCRKSTRKELFHAEIPLCRASSCISGGHKLAVQLVPVFSLVRIEVPNFQFAWTANGDQNSNTQLCKHLNSSLQAEITKQIS